MDTSLHPVIISWLSTLPVILTYYTLIGETDSPTDPLREAMLSFHALVLAPLSSDIQNFINESQLNPMELYATYKTNLKNLALSSQFVQTNAERTLQKYFLKANNLRTHFKLAICYESKALFEATPENFETVKAHALTILSSFHHEITVTDRDIRVHQHQMKLAVSRILKLLKIAKQRESSLVYCDQCSYKTNPEEMVSIYDSKICSTCYDDRLEGYDSF